MCIRDSPTSESSLRGASGIFFVRPTLGPADVDAKFLSCAEDVLVQLSHFNLLPARRQHFDVEAQGLHLLDEHLEALGDPRLGYVLALDASLVDLHPAQHVGGLY